MTPIILFPLPRPCRVRMALMGEAWITETDKRLTEYAGWLWPDGVPGWVGDGWWNFITHYREGGPVMEPDAADWPDLWEHFVAVWLAHQPEWKRQVEISLAELEEAA